MCHDSAVTGLDDALIAVAVNLASGALTGAAKAAWTRLKTKLIDRSGGDKRVPAWLDLLEADPSEEIARQVAKRLTELGLDADREVHAAVDVVSQTAIGQGATSAAVGVNNGTIGGVHITVGSHLPLDLTPAGRFAYNVTNTTIDLLTITGLEYIGARRDASSVHGLLPRVLHPGEGLKIILEPTLGAGSPSVRVTFLQNGHTRHQTMITKE